MFLQRKPNIQVLAANILVRILLPCLSNSLDKNTKIMSMFVLFSLLFSPCWMFGCFRKWGNLSQKQSNRMFSVNFSKVQQLRNIFATNSSYFDYTVRTNLTADTYVRHFKIKLYFCGKKLWLCGLFSGDKGEYLDAWMIKITIKTNQIVVNVCFLQK